MMLVDYKVKGLLKGLRYITQIFDGEKEQEMVIGNPTDVKHVAHIGWDGPTVNNPTWKNDFHSEPLSATFGQDGKDLGSPKFASQEIPIGGIPPPSPARDETESPRPRRTRRHASSEAPGSDSPSRDPTSRGTRHSRKHHSAGSAASAPGSDSPSRDGETRRARRHHKSDNTIGSESESPARDLPFIPKQSKKKERRSKGSDGGSSRSSTRSKNPSSEPGFEERFARPMIVEEAV